MIFSDTQNLDFDVLKGGCTRRFFMVNPYYFEVCAVLECFIISLLKRVDPVMNSIWWCQEWGAMCWGLVNIQVNRFKLQKFPFSWFLLKITNNILCFDLLHSEGINPQKVWVSVENEKQLRRDTQGTSVERHAYLLVQWKSCFKYSDAILHTFYETTKQISFDSKFLPVTKVQVCLIYNVILGIPIDRVPTSESCVFSLGRKFLFPPAFDCFLGPFCCKDYFLEQVLCM